MATGEKGIAGRFKWGMVLVPKGSTGKVGTQLTLAGMSISTNTKHKDAAWKFVKYLLEPDVQVPAILSGAQRPGLRKSVLRHPKLMAEMKSNRLSPTAAAPRAAGTLVTPGCPDSGTKRDRGLESGVRGAHHSGPRGPPE